MRRYAGLLLVLLVVGGFTTPPAVSAATTTVRIFPNADVAGANWNDASDGCQVDATRFDEVDEFPHDSGATCRSKSTTLGGGFQVDFPNPDVPGDVTDIDVRLVVVGRIFSGDAILTVSAFVAACGGNPTNPTTTETDYTTVVEFYELCNDEREWTLADLAAVRVDASCTLNVAPAGVCTVTQMYLDVVFTIPDGGGETPEPPISGGYGTFKNDFDLNYPSLFDLNADPSRRCSNITIEDTRSEAALAILYIWNFGDGTQEQTTKGSVGHTYAKQGLYTVTIRVQYRSGAIEIFLVNVNARGDECLFNEFVHDWFPILLLLIGLMVLAALTVQLSKRRGDPNFKRLLRRLFLLVALIAFAIMAAVVIYTSAMGIPI